ncbi:MAG: poly-beta-hydroxybutyrate polymerase N-terminal domain-containing protein [Rubrivivax sp.]|nr:poly-beta-hydroxybutyrate polymerase N-terminal domain-containing protein [Rubrivivax sp.]
MTPIDTSSTNPGTRPDAYHALDGLVHARLAEASLGLSPIALALAHADWAWHLAVSPGRQLQLAQKAQALALQVWSRAVNPAANDEAANAAESDLHFADEGWRHWPFRVWKDGFKATEAWWREAVQVEGLSAHHRHMVDFFARQAVDALSPANWPFTNPLAAQAALNSGGMSLLRGGQNLLQDLQEMQPAAMPAAKGEGDAASATMAPLPYAVGKDVAVTPGKVVYRNALFELIQYTPTTAQVHNEPLLVVPSCIMKYYILDLSPRNSMVRYLVDQGFTVFMMSWKNPDADDRELGMQDYLRRGVMEAMAVVKSRADAPRIHALGYCLGGTFLAIVAAVLGRLQRQAAARPTAPNTPAAARGAAAPPPRRRGDDLRPESLPELASVTLLAAQTDFSEPGELGVFIDDDQLRTLRENMARTGYLSGRAMAASFQFLNSSDLVWARNTRRYLLGQDDGGNDMMSWNADVTRLPERMHDEYLSSLFLNNALAAGHYRCGGEGVALRDISMPLLVLGTVRDHVSPWRSVYKIHLLTDTDTTFVLAAGGHNAGIVSEPGHPKRSYQIGHTPRGHGWTDPDAWLAQASTQTGSWWPAMADWLQQHASGQRKPPPIVRSAVLGKAPGTYVMVRYDD